MLVATSVFPVPGGPTIIVSPGLIPDLIAVSWVGVKVAGDPAPSRKVEGREEKRVEGGGLFRDGPDQGHVHVNVKTKKRQKKANH